MGMNMEARVATVDDADNLHVLNALFENNTTVDLLRKSLAENDREIACIAFADGVPAGYCCGLIVKSMCYSESRADIEALYVKPEYRGQGIGKALVKCLERALANRDVRHFHVTTGAGNKNALSMYEGLGYAKTGEVLLDKTICEEDLC